jgi:hypothetical protein
VHLVRGAAWCWILAAALSLLAPEAQVSLPLQSAGGRTAPVALLVPLISAAGTQFAVSHDAPWLIRLASRSLWRHRTAWALCAIVPAAAVSAAAAGYSDRITVGAAVRNCLLFASVAVLASWRLPPGVAVLPAATAALGSLVLVSSNGFVMDPQPWNWLAQVRATSEQLWVSTGLWAVAVVSLELRRPRV